MLLKKQKTGQSLPSHGDRSHDKHGMVTLTYLVEHVSVPTLISLREQIRLTVCYTRQNYARLKADTGLLLIEIHS